MEIKELFDKAENGTLTYDQFTKLCGENNAKFTDLSEGKYISKQKYDDEINGKVKEIETLNSTISTRDTDLAELKQKLQDAGTDAEKLTALTNDFDGLKTKYDTDVKNYKAQLKKQAYEFAVKEFANGRKFTSNAAKRDFINSMLSKDLKMENDTILGADDFVKVYSENNADAFVTEKEPEEPVPNITTSTKGTEPTQDNGFTEAFHFMGVRPQPNNNK